MNKRTLFVDYDGVIANSILAITQLYNKDFSAYEGFRPIDWSEIKTWDFDELELANRTYIDNYFNQPRFFETVEFMPFAKFSLEKICEFYDIKVISIGNTPNLTLKEKWIRNNMPYASFIGVNKELYNDKSHVNMNYVDSVFIDDLSDNLRKSNAHTKICFGTNYPWNQDWDGLRFGSWHDITDYLLKNYETKN